MIEVLEMCHLMGDDVPPDLWWREDQAPAEANAILRRATAPTASRIADADRARGNAGHSGELGHFARHRFECPALEKRFDSTGKTQLRAATVQFAGDEFRRAT